MKLTDQTSLPASDIRELSCRQEHLFWMIHTGISDSNQQSRSSSVPVPGISENQHQIRRGIQSK